MVSVETTLADLAEGDVVGRIWRQDHTVWKPSPDEIADRVLLALGLNGTT